MYAGEPGNKYLREAFRTVITTASQERKVKARPIIRFYMKMKN